MRCNPAENLAGLRSFRAWCATSAANNAIRICNLQFITYYKLRCQLVFLFNMQWFQGASSHGRPGSGHRAGHRRRRLTLLELMPSSSISFIATALPSDAVLSLLSPRHWSVSRHRCSSVPGQFAIFDRQLQVKSHLACRNGVWLSSSRASRRNCLPLSTDFNIHNSARIATQNILLRDVMKGARSVKRVQT